MLERSLQAQFLIPMAISLGFGVIFATTITLYLIPCVLMTAAHFQEVCLRTKTGIGSHSETRFEVIS